MRTRHTVYSPWCSHQVNYTLRNNLFSWTFKQEYMNQIHNILNWTARHLSCLSFEDDVSQVFFFLTWEWMRVRRHTHWPPFGGVWGMSLPEETQGADRGHTGEIMAFGWPETADKQLEDEDDYKPRGHKTRRNKTTHSLWQRAACAALRHTIS